MSLFVIVFLDVRLAPYHSVHFCVSVHPCMTYIAKSAAAEPAEGKKGGVMRGMWADMTAQVHRYIRQAETETHASKESFS